MLDIVKIHWSVANAMLDCIEENRIYSFIGG